MVIYQIDMVILCIDLEHGLMIREMTVSTWSSPISTWSSPISIRDILTLCPSVPTPPPHTQLDKVSWNVILNNILNDPPHVIQSEVSHHRQTQIGGSLSTSTRPRGPTDIGA